MKKLEVFVSETMNYQYADYEKLKKEIEVFLAENNIDTLHSVTSLQSGRVLIIGEAKKSKEK